MARMFATLLLALALSFSPVQAECGEDIPILKVTKDQWTTLNATISGRLHAGQPWALPCYSSYRDWTGSKANVPDPKECQAIGAGLTNSDILIQDFGSYHNPTFATCMNRDQKCTLSGSNFAGLTNDTCFQGTVPDYYVDARDVTDIQAALKFARLLKIPVTIKNTGHDYKGRSTGPHTLAIWTKNIVPDLDINEDFTPEACSAPVGPVVTYGAGQTGIDMYEKLDGTGYFAVGGSCTTVGVSGGWVAGGGHSIVSPTYGLGVDNVIQMKVVLPDGTFVTANRCQNQDIFFALRGGGGGTFGVVTETTAKLHKDRSFVYAFLSMAVPAGPRDINEILVANGERWAQEGWGGLYGVDVGSATTFLGFNPHFTVEEARQSLKPLTDYFESMETEDISYVDKVVLMESHWAAQNAPELRGFLASEAGVSLTRSSRLVPRENFETSKGQAELVDVLVANPWAAVLGAPTSFELPESDLPGGPGESSITPAWRNAMYHFTYTAVWDQADPAATEPEALTEMFTKISKQMDPMRAITPDAGAYMSEGDVYEPNPIQSFWGQKNYDRLLKIKKELDPDNLLSCFTCVGYEPKHPRHKCYPQVRDENQNLLSNPLKRLSEFITGRGSDKSEL